MDITCPSGLAGTIRGMKGKEAQAFFDPKMQRTLGSLDALYANCWTATSSPGPYKIEDSGKPPWGSLVLAGDRFHTMIMVRGLTFGFEYDFDVKCQSCSKKYGWELDLRELERKPLPTESFDKIQNGSNRFHLALSDGKALDFKLPTAVEEKLVTNLKGGPTSEKQIGPVDAVWAQVLSIGDRDPESGIIKPIPGDRFGFRRYLEDLGYSEILDLLTDMQGHDCGVETKIETICEFCSWQQWIELPFQRSFFESRRKKKTA